MKERLKNKVIIEAAHITEIYGPVQALRNYLQKRSEEFLFIAHPFSCSSLKRSKARLYEDGCQKKVFIGPKNVGPEILHYLKDILFAFRSAWEVKRKVDLFIGVDNLNAFVGVWLRRLGKVKRVIYYVIDYTPQRFDNRFLNALYHWVDGFCIKHANYIWNLSERIAQTKGKQRVPKKRNMVVPVGVELEKISRVSADQINRKRLVIMSHLTKAKGIQLVIDAMSEITRKIPEVELVVIGTGPYERKLKNMVKERGLQEKVKFLGAMGHGKLFEFLPSCGIGLATYSPNPDNIAYYADPTKPKEYLACGLPLIITKVPWIAQEVEKKKMGIAINYNREELVNAIIKLLSDGEFYSECRKNAIEFASKLSWDKIYDEAFGKIEEIDS